MSLDRFEKMTQREKDEFSKICNKLMSATYMLRDGTDKLVSREYRFIENEFELFSDYLSLGGWKIYKDAQYGIIYVRNVEGYNKLALNKLTTVMLITMRIIYEDMRVQASNTNDVCVNIGELFGKIVNEFSLYPKKPPQKEIKESFRILENHNIIRRLDESYDDIECRFVVLPSILVAVPNEKCKTICDMLNSFDSNSEKSTQSVKMFSKYQTYLTFDLITTDSSGRREKLSKSINTKSGGETQTPFYIAVLASFARLYRTNDPKETGNTMRLVIFDEAFNKMDGERIIESIKLLRKFGLQAIICSPPEKASDIAPIADKTQLVYKEAIGEVYRSTVVEWTKEMSEING